MSFLSRSHCLLACSQCSGVTESPRFNFCFTELFALPLASSAPTESMGVLSLGNRPLSRSIRIFWHPVSARQTEDAQCKALASAGLQDPSLARLGMCLAAASCCQTLAPSVRLCFLSLRGPVHPQVGELHTKPIRNHPLFMVPHVYSYPLPFQPA